MRTRAGQIVPAAEPLDDGEGSNLIGHALSFGRNYMLQIRMTRLFWPTVAVSSAGFIRPELSWVTGTGNV